MLRRIAPLVCGVGVVMAAAVAAQQGGASLTALDFYLIHELSSRYNHALDRGDGQALADLFTADAVLVEENGRTVQGREALVAYANATAGKGPTNVRHFYVNLAIDPVPGGAKAHSHAMVVVPQAGQPDRVRNSGQFWDEYVKVAERWQIRRRTFHKATAPWPGTMPLATTFPNVTASAATQRANGLSAQDYADVHQLYAKSAVAYDKVLEQGRMWANLFTADGVFVDLDGKSTTGREQLQQAAWIKGVKPVTTFITNVVLEQSPAGVNGRAYLMRRTIPPLPEAPYEEPAGMVFDQIVRTQEGWRFRNRTMVRVNAPVPAAVAQAPPAPR